MGDARIVPATEEMLAEAARILVSGGVIAFPTDTVYGICCDLFNSHAVQRIYEIKERPAGMPLIAMFAQMPEWQSVAGMVSPRAQAYMRRWWPGALTIIAPARADIPSIVLGEGSTIGMRVPDHATARRLLALAARPLATTSANLSGTPPACDAAQVAEQLAGRIDMILDGGASPQGAASTVLDCSVDPPAILRDGPVTREMLGLL